MAEQYDYDGMSSDFKVLGEFNELQAARITPQLH